MSNRIENIYLHIGQSKTGTSYMQSSFAAAVPNLEARSIAYPIDFQTASMARAGQITSGNFWPREGALQKLALQAMNSGFSKLLISSEAIFSMLCVDNPQFIPKLQALFPGAQISVLVFLRSPVERAISVYQQRVKRGGFQGNLSESLKDYAGPSETVRALQVLEEFGVNTTIRNYDLHKNHLLEVAEDWLGIEHGVLPKPVFERVNRSMTNAELELQRVLNGHIGESASRLVSDPLCNNLRDIKSEFPPLSSDDLKNFLFRMSEEMQSSEYLRLVPEGERPAIGKLEDYVGRFSRVDQDLQMSFSAEQIRVFADAIGRELAKLSDQ